MERRSNGEEEAIFVSVSVPVTSIRTNAWGRKKMCCLAFAEKGTLTPMNRSCCCCCCFLLSPPLAWDAMVLLLLLVAKRKSGCGDELSKGKQWVFLGFLDGYSNSVQCRTYCVLNCVPGICDIKVQQRPKYKENCVCSV